MNFSFDNDQGEVGDVQTIVNCIYCEHVWRTMEFNTLEESNNSPKT